MLEDWFILLASLAYLGLLFAIASLGDLRADAGRSIISNPYVYTLSIAVYCTAWTYYGSVGRAAATGIGFLPIYLGPTLMATLWWPILRKIIRIAKAYRITSIADFIASRYRKSALLSGLVTVIAVVGIMPYIALQLKAIATSFTALHYFPDIAGMAARRPVFGGDTAFFVTLILAIFSILFGTRSIDVTERHEGMVAAIAFESVVKLLAFSAAGLFVTFVMFDGPADLFAVMPDQPETAALMELSALAGGFPHWFSLMALSMMAILFLPRQFQVLVVESTSEEHVRKAAWLFPAYLFLINLFVIPIALAGRLLFPEGGFDPDLFVLLLPISEEQELLALFVYLGGLSAATGMVIVETIALSTMVCNDLVMPVLLRLAAFRQKDLSRLLLAIRRGSIMAVLFLGYLYFRLIGESYALVSMGLLSFAAAAQFGPAILLGISWKGATRRGALCGLAGGFAVWIYTLLLPSLSQSGWLSAQLLSHGPFGIAFLRPQQLFGLDMFDPITHALFWSMLVNIGGLVTVSLIDRPSVVERIQATLFVDIFRRSGPDPHLWRGKAMVAELKDLVARFIGPAQADRDFADYAARRGLHLTAELAADAELVDHAERLLSGVIGAASARIMVSSVVAGEEISQEGILMILDETSQAIEYSHRLEQQSRELAAAYQQLQELDRLKDEFISTVSHELRTPLTSIRAFSEILQDHPEVAVQERQRFLGIIVKESERLTRLTNQVLDLTKLESGRAEWLMAPFDLREVVTEAIATTSQLFDNRQVRLEHELPGQAVTVEADRDRLLQVVINLLSNAVKFSPAGSGLVQVQLRDGPREVRLQVTDNGPGIAAEEQEAIFERFHQIRDPKTGKPKGTGLGLAICRRIVEHHQGHIWVESLPGRGARFIVTLPR
ncbi:MAG: ATP-binding protein [Thermodesulfobacteriota bacterium]